MPKLTKSYNFQQDTGLESEYEICYIVSIQNENVWKPFWQKSCQKHGGKPLTGQFHLQKKV